MVPMFPIDRAHLYPENNPPVEFPEDFYLQFPRGDGLNLKMGPARPFQINLQQQPSPSFPTALPYQPQPNFDVGTHVRTQPIVNRLLRVPENRQIIEEETLKQVAPEAVNVNVSQYQNLIPLSFDEEQFIRQEEEKRMRKREKAAAAAGVTKP